MTDRALAIIKAIDSVSPIEKADMIEVVHIGGWAVVVKKGEFKVGDKVVYIEIDSWVPTTLAPFLSKGKTPKQYNNVDGERLRTIKLRGQLSQGLVLPVPADLAGEALGSDVTSTLNVQKWEKPISANLAGVAKGNFPSFIPKTDQERIQNISNQDLHDMSYNHSELFEITEKMNGSSITIYKRTDPVTGNAVVGVCSRNLDLDLDQEGNTFVNAARESNLLEVLRLYPYDIAVQGELCGPGIQGNWHGLGAHSIFIFDIFDITAQKYFSPYERYSIFHSFKNVDLAGGIGKNAFHVKIHKYEAFIPISTSFERVREVMFQQSDYKLANGNCNEGLVWKSTSSQVSFKVINNKFLLGGYDE